ncbi:hypothetical protein TYRP_016891 [Tyrophagus putrescentiae]|nr:hypothetical protein TYRP_016891 [Tyrophagus putrescentiae]
MIAVRRQITSSQLPAQGLLLLREVRYGLEEEILDLATRTLRCLPVLYIEVCPAIEEELLLEASSLLFNQQELPAQFRAEPRQKKATAEVALRQLVTAYGSTGMMPASEGHRLGELLRTVTSHLNLLAAIVGRFSEGGGVPLDLRYHFKGDLCQEGEPALFVVDRTAVFKEPEIEGRLEEEELSNDRLFRRLHFSHTVIGARHLVLALVRFLIRDLRSRGAYLPGYGLQLIGGGEEQVQEIVRGKEEAMMAAATQFMAALQAMSVAVHRHLEAAGAFQDGH